MTALKHADRVGRKYRNPIETRVGGPGMIFGFLRQVLVNKEERVPKRPLGPFRTDTEVYKRAPETGLRITWMGHSVMLIEIDGVRVLVDPVWDKRASPFAFAGPKRFYDSPLALEQLPPLDAVLISHDHYDHLGKQTIRALAKLPAAMGAQWITSSGVGRELRNFGVNAGGIRELNWTDSVNIAADLKITALPARHFSGRTPWNRFHTLWSSFVLQGTRHCIFYGADSGLWNGFGEIGSNYGPFDLTMLEVGAFNELWKSIHMGPDGAAEAFAAMGAHGLLMPIHWGLFDLALHSWQQPIQRITELADERRFKLWSPTPGVPTDVVVGQELRSAWWKDESDRLLFRDDRVSQFADSGYANRYGLTRP